MLIGPVMQWLLADVRDVPGQVKTFYWQRYHVTFGGRRQSFHRIVRRCAKLNLLHVSHNESGGREGRLHPGPQAPGSVPGV